MTKKKKSADFLDRELSWLQFNTRVLQCAEDSSIPLLERIKFLAITASNLDEFFMVRVGGLAGVYVSEQAVLQKGKLRTVLVRCAQMIDQQYRCWAELTALLQKSDIVLCRKSDLTAEQHDFARHFFDRELLPLLSPVAIDASDSVPLIRNLLLHVCIELRSSRGKTKNEIRHVIVPLPKTVSRFVTLPARKGLQLIAVDELIALFAQQWFAGEEVVECRALRITRNADLSVAEERAADLQSGMEEVLLARKRSDCVRLEIEAGSSATMVTFLSGILDIVPDIVFYANGPVELRSLMLLHGLPGFDSLRFTQWEPQQSSEVKPNDDMFALLSKKNLLLHHPYESFDPVLRFIEQAAIDPDVVAIKQTLYRTSAQSPVIEALRTAARNGKHVTVIVELKARFDEERNIGWAKTLEDEGALVIYGVRQYKTHAKVCIVLRREASGLQRYVHVGTGNYNEITARQYTDLSLLSADEDLGADATSFFNCITGYSQPQSFRRIEMAPLGMRDRICELIDGEIARCTHGQKALIMAKMNALVDEVVIEHLYRASQAGVHIMLNIRGICCLRPGVKGLSENITVVSIVDRYLEHARISYFHNGGEAKVYISSADWMPRNLDKRIELMVPVFDAQSRQRLYELLVNAFKDTGNTWVLDAKGAYSRRTASKPGKQFHLQEHCYQEACNNFAAQQSHKPTVFEPHRSPDAKG